MRQQTETKFECTGSVLGPDEGHVMQVRYLNILISWTSGGIEYEADAKHAETILAEIGIKCAKDVSTPELT